MDKRDALRQGRQLLRELGVSYTLVLDARPTRRLGQCRFTTRTIGLSTRFVIANEWRLVEQTVRHEAAHAAVGPGYGHGPVWQRKAREFGVERPGSAMRDPELRMAPAAIAIVCPRCGVVGGRNRMPAIGRQYRHNACGETVRFEKGRKA